MKKMSIIDKAREFLESSKDLAHEALHEALKALPKDVQHKYWELKKESYFAPDHKHGEPSIHLSESGKYRLVDQMYETEKGYTGHSRGMVYEGDRLIADVKRNYAAFPFLFIEGHPNGHDYLVCGADYQGQTVIELDTGLRKDLLSDGSDNGWGFCWAAYKFNRNAQVLVVDGCFWACPYEFRLYDFSDPMKSGWPWLEPEEAVDADSIQPEINENGMIVFWMSHEEGEDDHPIQVKDASVTYRREGNALVKVDEWVSEDEKKRRVDRAEANRLYEEYKANFYKTDPLFLEYKKLLADPKFSPEDYEGWGGTYEGWCPDFDKKEKRFCRRIVKQKKLSIELQWATDTGPIKLIVYKNDKNVSTTFYLHSVGGMREAFAVARTWL